MTISFIDTGLSGLGPSPSLSKYSRVIRFEVPKNSSQGFLPILTRQVTHAYWKNTYATHFWQCTWWEELWHSKSNHHLDMSMQSGEYLVKMAESFWSLLSLNSYLNLSRDEQIASKDTHMLLPSHVRKWLWIWLSPWIPQAKFLGQSLPVHAITAVFSKIGIFPIHIPLRNSAVS